MKKGIKFASIDIGSNAMRLLFCRVIKDKKNRHTFSKEALFRMPLRLGEDAFSLGFITDKNIVKLQEAKVVRITNAGSIEGHPHDVFITREAPNYSKK